MHLIIKLNAHINIHNVVMQSNDDKPLASKDNGSQYQTFVSSSLIVSLKKPPQGIKRF